MDKKLKLIVRRTLATISAILIALTGAFYWYFLDGGLVGNSRFTVDFSLVRKEAKSHAGRKPTNIQVEKVAQFYFPRTLSVAGSGFDIVPMGVYSFRLVSPSGNVIIDTGYDSEMAQSARADFFEKPYARMQSAMNSAAIIAITHEHYDHIGGIVKHANPASLASKLRLTEEQVSSPKNIRPRFNGGVPSRVKPVSLGKYLAIAPGVVLIKAHGHTPGNVMIFVQLENGQEYLFVGDVAWLAQGIDKLKIRPRAISSFFLPEEDRTIISGQMKYLNSMQNAEPSITIIAGHDNRQIELMIENGDMTATFVD
jgi:glyoxylase-like metal-dependent hydrolase (beta-lactamase superfamily II)